MENKYQRLFCLIIISVLISSCSSSDQKNKNDNTNQLKLTENTKTNVTENTFEVNSKEKMQLEIKTYLNTDKLKGWGYDVYLNGALYVHQPHIPAINGEKGFESKDEAKRVGDFVGKKIMNNIMPPSLSIEELDSLKINMSL